MRKAQMALVSTAAFCALVCATPAAAQEQPQVQPAYRPLDFVPGIAGVLTWPFLVLVGPYQDLVTWSHCQRTQQQTGHEWRTVTVCN